MGQARVNFPQENQQFQNLLGRRKKWFGGQTTTPVDWVLDAGEWVFDWAILGRDGLLALNKWGFESLDEQAFELPCIGPRRSGFKTDIVVVTDGAKRQQEFLDTPASFEEVHDFPNEYLTFTIQVENTC